VAWLLEPVSYMQMKVFSPIMKRDPRGKLFAESMVCVLLPMRLYQQT
jgi:hypothetical protein